MASPEAKNLEAISKAIDQHNRNCPFPAAEVRMNPFEVERLGWEEIRGLPVVPDSEIGTGRFRIVCSQELDDAGLEETEAVGRELVETVAPTNRAGALRTEREATRADAGRSDIAAEEREWETTLVDGID
ncbi:MAG: hypothetical protein WDZ46_04775 [Solirubrobacterales bacterium]